MDNSLNIDPIELTQTLNLLKSDNEKINVTLKNINDLVIALDKNKWDAPEKDKIDAEVIPYLENQRKNILFGLNNCVAVITKARDNYVATNNSLVKVAETLDNYDNLEGDN